MLEFDGKYSGGDSCDDNASQDNVCAGRLARCGVLIAEADQAQAKLISRFLEAEGARVTMAPGSAEAVAMLFGREANDNDTDVVLMNANLPNVCDIDAVGRLRDGGFHRTIIAIAWKRDDQNRAALKNAGYNDVIIKPVCRDELITKVEFFFNRSKASPSFD
ncbi:MAG TPA: response regulator [Phycisphaerae bacterium]|nr:response regulator [Phycisphaerae bacterium]